MGRWAPVAHLLPLLILLLVLVPAGVHGATPAELDEAVETGIVYFQGLCGKQQGLVADLASAIETDDMDAARDAYVLSRHPYEQIEVLANSFEDIDGEIDARPYAWDLGERDEAWLGFHVVERALYRDLDLKAAADATERLRKSVNDLCDALADLANFTPQSSFQGIISLASEVPNKKISSEEEAWSDQSWLIFRENYKGIWSQVSPFLPLLKDETSRTLLLRYQAVKNVIMAGDPTQPFTSEKAAIPYSDVPIDIRASLVQEALLFVETLTDAQTQLIGTDAVARTVITKPVRIGRLAARADAEELAAATDVGRLAFVEQCTILSSVVDDLVDAIDGGDIDQARAAYLLSRPSYEQIEILAANFETEDKAIDARPDAYDLGERDPEWQGFHAIERALYRENSTDAAAAYSERLQDSVTSLCEILDDDSGENFNAATTWRGVLAISLEVTAKKISSEEETFSDLSLLIFRENWKGIWSQYIPFGDLLPADIQMQLNDTNEAFIDAYTNVLDKDNGWEGTSFRVYSDVPNEERKLVSDLCYALFGNLSNAYEILSLADAEGPKGDTEDGPSDKEGDGLPKVDIDEGSSDGDDGDGVDGDGADGVDRDGSDGDGADGVDGDGSDGVDEDGVDGDGADGEDGDGVDGEEGTSGDEGEVGGSDGEESDEPVEVAERDAVCFPNSGQVQVESRGFVRMDSIRLGDRVMVSPGVYAPVIGFSHKDTNAKTTFTQLSTSDHETITLSPSHYLVDGTGQLKSAGSVRLGDALRSASGDAVTVEKVDTIVARGLIAPHTSSFRETIVVDGMVASEHTTHVHPKIASILLAPFRVCYPVMGNLLEVRAAQETMVAFRSIRWLRGPSMLN